MLNFRSILGSLFASKTLYSSKPRFLKNRALVQARARFSACFLAKWHENSLQNSSRNALLSYIAFCIHFYSQNRDFESRLAHFLASFWNPFRIIFAICSQYRFLNDFFSILSALGAPRGGFYLPASMPPPLSSPPLGAYALWMQLHSR